MKAKHLFLLALVSISAIAFSSCKNASKAKPLIEDVVKSYKAASKTDAVRYWKARNRVDMANKIYDGYIAPTPCSTCNGYGVVYQIDAYGNAITDYYGNIQYFYCPHCNGTGKEQLSDIF